MTSDPDLITLDELADRLGFEGEKRGRRALRLLRQVEEDRGIFLVIEAPNRRPRYQVRASAVREHLRSLAVPLLEDEEEGGPFDARREIEALQEALTRVRRELHLLAQRLSRVEG